MRWLARVSGSSWALIALLGLGGIAPFAASSCDRAAASPSVLGAAPARIGFEPIAAQPLPPEQRDLVARLEIFGDDAETPRVIELHTGDSPALQRELVATGIRRVAPGRYLAPQPPASGRGYALTLVRSGQLLSYVTEDGAEAPAALRRAIACLEPRE